MPHPLDAENLEDVILHSPEQFQAGMRAAASVSAGALAKAEPVERVLVAGMGGSGLAGALVRAARLSAVPVQIHLDYGLPAETDPSTLVIASSFSGNTEETLSAFDAAKAAGAPVVGVSAGGELERRCAADGIPFVKIPADPPTMQPRYATGYGVGIITQLLATLGSASAGAVGALAGLGTFLQSFMPTARERGEALVPKLQAATPVVYAADRFADVARVWKIKINENAKAPAFWHVFPELNHNEMTGWEHPQGPFHVVYLQAADDHPRVQKRLAVSEALLREKGISGSIVPIEGRNLVEQIFSTLLVGDWASYGLALGYGIDPSPVPMVEELKRRLRA